jgi:hypothetical protein
VFGRGDPDGNGVTAAGGTAGALGGDAGRGAEVHEGSKATAPDPAVTASVRRAAPVFTASA